MSVMCRDTDNFFLSIRDSFGRDCYKKKEKITKVRKFLYRYISWQSHYKKVVQNLVRGAIEYHRDHQVKEVTTEPGEQHHEEACAEHSVLVLGAHLCQKYNIVNDRPLLHELFLELFRCDQGFDRFMTFLDPLAFPFELDSDIYPFQCDVSTGTITPRHLKVLEYFLGVAASIKVNVKFSAFDFTSRAGTYSTYMSRVAFVDVPVPACRGSTPLLLACHSINPESVLLLLRHGADPLRPGQVHRIIGLQFQHPLYVIITKLNASVFWRTHNHHLDQAVRKQFVTKQNSQDDNLKRCLTYFCRSSLRLPVAITQHVTATNNQVFQLHPTYKGLIPEERCGGVAELTHICRCSIRQSVQANGSLPSGLYELPLPTLLKRYLDLLMD